METVKKIITLVLCVVCATVSKSDRAMIKAVIYDF